ncbi:MAG: NAD-dependent epimerase/dehydratase family protein, partial [Myxococcota bacterium]
WRERGGKLVYAGSSTKFGDNGRAREAPPYASTKAANTELVREVGERHKLAYAIAYFYNVYGPRERSGVYGTVIEMFKRMYLAGSPFAVTSPGTQKRNFTHVDDIVDGLIAVGQRGQGDEYGLGNERAFTILEVAQLFGGDIVMLPPRAGNRMEAGLDTRKSRTLGWKPTRSLEEYIMNFTREHPRGTPRERRVLVFSTTFYPIMGPAERALATLMRKMPDVRFDIVTTRFAVKAVGPLPDAPNVEIHRSGIGQPLDKYLLPLSGFLVARALHAKHRYLFAWSLMASYAALAGILLKYTSRLPLLVTLADQRLSDLSSLQRPFFTLVLSDADQVYGASPSQETHASGIFGRPLSRSSLGEGDAFANQLRYAYAEILMTEHSAA